MGIELDHIVLGAATIEDGVRYVRECLGVEIPPGGKHPLMGTHNHLMRLGETAYFEVIAIDPDAPPPSRPRWFALDDPEQQRRLRECPRLIAWVARVDDIDAVASTSPVPLGEIIPATRASLSWRMTVAADGRLSLDGLAPQLIQWDGGVRPWEAMADRGCTLDRLSLGHPQAEQLRGVLRALDLDRLDGLIVDDEEPEPTLWAAIRTPAGLGLI